VRDGFNLLATLEPDRFAVIDAAHDEMAVAAAIARTVETRLASP
jgi:thymidylate kinase